MAFRGARDEAQDRHRQDKGSARSAGHADTSSRSSRRGPAHPEWRGLSEKLSVKAQKLIGTESAIRRGGDRQKHGMIERWRWETIAFRSCTR